MKVWSQLVILVSLFLFSLNSEASFAEYEQRIIMKILSCSLATTNFGYITTIVGLIIIFCIFFTLVQNAPRSDAPSYVARLNPN